MSINGSRFRIVTHDAFVEPREPGAQARGVPMRRLWKFVRPLRTELLVLFLLLLGNALLKLPVPFLTIYLIDRVIPSKSPHLLFAFVLVIIAMSVLFITSEFVRSYYGYATSRKLSVDIHIRLLSHVERLPLSYFASKDTGYIMSRFLDDASQLNSLVTDNLLTSLQSAITFVIGIGAVFYINWDLALASLIILPPFILSTLKHGERLRGLNIKAQEAKAVVSRNLHETISGITVIKAFARERWTLVKSFAALKAAVRAELRAVIASAKLSSSVSFWGSVGSLFVLCYGGYEVMTGRLTLGQLLGFNSVLAYLYGPSQALATGYIAMQRSFGSLQRVSEMLDIDPEPGFLKTTDESVWCGDLPIETLSFEQVCFSYKSSKPVLDDITFTINAPAIVAVTGESGVGKSTLLKLLLRFYDPEEGRIYLDGVNLRSLDIVSLRRLIGFVPQDTFLFNTSILDNIRMGKRDATDAEVMHAAQMANAHDFIVRLPQGYRTVVGSSGQKLSVGQRQRIALARAILIQPKILILDEASSSVDSPSEEAIWNSLKQMSSARLVFIVSHRFSSLLHADITMFLQEGRLAGFGTHAELMRNPLYHHMYEQQLQLQA